MHLANDEYYNLGSKTFWYFFSKKSITGFVFLILALIVAMTRSSVSIETAGLVRVASWVFFIIAVGAFLVALVSSKLVYKNTGFMLSDDALMLSRGVIKKEQFAIPYRQIQNIEIERTLGDQMLGISRLIILTAGLETTDEQKEDEPEGILPAIDKDIASTLQRELLKRANIQKIIQG